MAYQTAAIQMTFGDLHDHSPTASFSKCIFRTVVQQLTTFQLTCCVARSLCDSWACCVYSGSL